jgi:nucleotide-binding universal stress UspA family protein
MPPAGRLHGSEPPGASSDRPSRRVVVGFDGTAASLAALTFAADEATLRGAGLHVVTAHEPVPPRRAPYARPGRPPAEPADSDDPGVLDKKVTQALSAPADTHEHVLGHPPAVLLEAAQGAELLVVGRASEAAVLGPTARACVIGSPCPVVVVSQQRVAGREVSRAGIPAGTARGRG